jgi:glycine/D-amino acid oxidase-like deaminating enzyme
MSSIVFTNSSETQLARKPVCDKLLVNYSGGKAVPASAEGGIKSIVNGPITFSPDANPMIGPAYGLTNA